ncbi:methyltransferase [Nocardiopsis coralliicola]
MPHSPSAPSAAASPKGRADAAPLSGAALRIFDLATASWVAAAVTAAADLGVADAMSDRPAPVADLAAQVGADTDALHRLLRACADLDIVEEHPGRCFALTDTGRALRTDAPDSLRNYARWVGSRAERATMAHLADAVRSGGPVFADVHGAPVWEHMRSHPRDAALFDQGMTDISAQITRSLAAEFDFGGVHRLVDVGGGRGRLLAMLLTAYPHLSGVLYDRPEVIAEPDPLLAQPELAGRFRVEGGDFCTRVPEGGDAYLLASVIHNWNDADSARILAHCRDAMDTGGRLLLAEVVVPEEAAPARTATFMDLSMLAHCGGKQRTPTEFTTLLTTAGFRLTGITDCTGVSVVEGVPA